MATGRPLSVAVIEKHAFPRRKVCGECIAATNLSLFDLLGVGLPFDGLYYVKSVSHDIKRGEYKQRFTLARNALMSTLPTVPM